MSILTTQGDGKIQNQIKQALKKSKELERNIFEDKTTRKGFLTDESYNPPLVYLGVTEVSEDNSKAAKEAVKDLEECRTLANFALQQKQRGTESRAKYERYAHDIESRIEALQRFL